MAKEKITYDSFAAYMPEGAFAMIKPWFEKYVIKLTITKARKSILGNYLHPHTGHPHHAITINGNQNKYSFLVTLVHELAHLEAFVRYKNNIAPHGREWQAIYRDLMNGYLGKNIFPEPLERVLTQSLQKVKAGSCSDPVLHKALSAYDEELIEGLKFLDELPLNSYFVTKEGRVFQSLEKRRTRFLCKDIASARNYYISGVLKVKPIEAAYLKGKGLIK
jgi:SprT protein